MLSGKAKLAGVIGWPVSHSKSPRLHGYWLEKHTIDGAYVPLAVKPDDLHAVVRGLVKAGFRGVNITVPHKENVMAVCDQISEQARRIGAVNTLVFHEDGSVHGMNTDGYGFLENLKQGPKSWHANSGPAVVLGAGGAARAVCAALLEAGAPEIHLLNRTVEKAEQVAKDLGSTVNVHSLTESAKWLPGAALLVNTTTLGMNGAEPLHLDLSPLAQTAVVTDIVYAPLETDLLKAAKARGNPTVDGLGMLLHQARPGFEAWFGVKPEVTPELRAFVLAEAP
ncbi:MAG: shikimate dehydrogenase [Alphaproteobacteria bacterium RIFOXYD12_FULL_60_8]|nr:MAG: shikimate dehydrogenase [Alphaproteobacteria bacterium RIFOXYD12_FULL_60_8]